jgi:pyridoxamine 5'-phosphate oxidase
VLGAVDAGVTEPHAMTVSTVDAQGMPRARVVHDGARASAEDFRARPVGSRAMALTLRQSRPLRDVTEVETEIEEAHSRLNHEPDLVLAEWISYAVHPSEVEFWEGSPDRRHRRLAYYLIDDGWDRIQLWP